MYKGHVVCLSDYRECFVYMYAYKKTYGMKVDVYECKQVRVPVIVNIIGTNKIVLFSG